MSELHTRTLGATHDPAVIDGMIDVVADLGV